MDHEFLAREETLALSSALIDLAGAGRRLVNVVIGRLPLDGSRAALQLLDPINDGEHDRGPITVALASVTRGSVAHSLDARSRLDR